MSTSTTSTSISGVGRVIVPVTDQDRALDFYTRALGLETRVDLDTDEAGRWVEVASAGAATTLALAVPRGDMWGDVGVDTRISLNCTEIDSVYAALRDHGVDVDPEIVRLGGPVPPFFFLRDPDGNTLQIVEDN